MFGLKNILKNTSNGPLKVMASNSFLDALNNVNKIAETQVKERDVQRTEEANTFYNDAKKIINRCTIMKDFRPEYLKEAAEKLIKSIELNRNNAEAYLNLANIFYTLGNNTLAAKYMKTAKRIKPELEGVDKLTNLISNEGIRNPSPDSNVQNVLNTRPAVPVSSTQPIKPQTSSITRVPVRKI
jgi:tetratricopeptide (TPR) repeat protein